MTDTEYTENNAVDITVVVTGKAVVILNGEPITGDENAPNKLHVNMKEEGDLLVTVNGEDFQHE